MFRHCCVVVVMWLTAVAQAQQQPTIAPLSYTAFLDPSDVSVRFTCTGEGDPLWRVDGQVASNNEITNREISIETNEEDGSFTSQIIIPATVENNNTEVQCIAVADIVVSSETATFMIQGPLAPPPNLTIVDNEADACSIYKLVWSAPFTLDVSGVNPDISTYTICNNITGYDTCSNTSGSGVMEHVFPKLFCYVEFRVSAVNGAGQGNESLVDYKPYTSDVQHASIYAGPGEINVTCCFAVGSQALGCHVLIYMSTTPVAFGDIRRENTTDSSSMKWYLSDSATGVISGLEVGTYSVYLSDIERDNTVDLTKVPHVETVNITETAPTSATTDDEPTDASTSATASEVITATSTTELDATSTLVTTSVSPTNSNLIVVVVSMAVILVAGVLVLAALVCTCVVWFRRRKESPSFEHEGSDVPVVMRANDAYQMVKISRTGRDGVDMDQCSAYGVVGNK